MIQPHLLTLDPIKFQVPSISKETALSTTNGELKTEIFHVTELNVKDHALDWKNVTPMVETSGKDNVITARKVSSSIPEDV